VKTWLLDASVLLAAEDHDDSNHADAARLLEGPDGLATLDLALYEVTTVAITAWQDRAAAARLSDRVTAIADDAGLIRSDAALMAAAADTALRHGISVYDAAYVAAALSIGACLVSCDLRDLVAPGLAVLPRDALEAAEA
jgi:predicted nucleic acid-binding protein